MHLDDQAKEFPAVERPERYTSARIWRCRYTTLAPLSAFVRLRELKILVYPDSTLEPLATLAELETLEITHLPSVTTLDPLSKLTRLRNLMLATLPSWNASSKTTTIASLGPLAGLPLLQDLRLFGVRPPDRRVDDLLRIPSLRTARVSKYPKPEADRLAQALDRRTSPVT
jgi:hypothetical protein